MELQWIFFSPIPQWVKFGNGIRFLTNEFKSTAYLARLSCRANVLQIRIENWGILTRRFQLLTLQAAYAAYRASPVAGVPARPVKPVKLPCYTKKPLAFGF